MERRTPQRGACTASPSFLSVSAVALVWLLSLVGCLDGHVACDPAACPEGHVCDPDRNECVPAQAAPAPVGTPGAWAAVAIAPTGEAVVASYDVALNALVLSTRGDDQTLEHRYLTAGPTGDRLAGAGPYVSLAFSPEGLPAMAYRDRDARALGYAHFDGSAWHSEVVPFHSRDYGHFSSLRIDSRGRPHIAFYDAETARLAYATRVEGRFQTEVVSRTAVRDAQQARTGGDSAPSPEPPPGLSAAVDYGRYASLGLSGDQPVVAFYEAVRGDLLLARRTPDGWQVQFVDGGAAAESAPGGSPRDVGRHASLAVDSFGDIAIAYYDATGGVLRFAHSAGGVLTVETVDDGATHPDGAAWPQCGRHSVGQRAQLAVDRSRRPSIAYFDATDLTLRLAHRRGDGTWQRRLLDETPGAGLWLSHATTGERSFVAYSQVDLFRGHPLVLRLIEVAPW
jgi:hypothetical protein